MTAKIDRTFAEKLLRTFDDPQEYGVHFLFNDWWAAAPQDAIDAYLDHYRSHPGADRFLADRYLADPVNIDQLADCPNGSLGRAYHDFLVDNNLEKNLAVNYGQLHQFMASSGALDAMPDDFKYAIIRGFQVHDILHVLSGYEPNPYGELALQAFSLAQLHFPYFGMWMATTTARMTLLEPQMIGHVMDAISEGWRYGKQVKQLNFVHWEERFDEPLADLRREFGIAPEGKLPLAA